MSRTRHTDIKVRSYSITHPPGTALLPTQPGWDQVLFAPSGVFAAYSNTEAWTIPPHRAMCVPGDISVKIVTTRRTPIRCLYLTTDLQALNGDPRIVSLSPLCRELLSRAITTAPFTVEQPATHALVTLLVSELGRAVDDGLRLPLPVDPTAVRVADAIRNNPSASLSDLVAEAHAHRRTIERRFSQETSMTLGQWHRRSRVLRSIELLAEGSSVTDVANEIGYASPSAFVAAFRSEFGLPPRRFMRSDKPPPSDEGRWQGT